MNGQVILVVLLFIFALAFLLRKVFFKPKKSKNKDKDCSHCK